MKMAELNQITKRRYSDQVVDSLKAEILSNRFAVGDRLPGEKDLTEAFKVSRTVVREAIRALEEAGLVEIKKGPKGGVFVTRVFHKPVSSSLKSLADNGKITIDHLFDVRLVIEPYIAAEAARKATAEDLKSLRALMEESSSHEDDVSLLKQNNINFHLLLAKAARNPVLLIMMESVILLLGELTEEFRHLPSGQEWLKVHMKLLSLVEQGLSEEASAMMTKDISEIRKRLKKYLRASPSVPYRGQERHR
jgi:GntR family transcriptional regulator, transcriptional repressor for pyruvate dehydrogenase complex